MKLTTMDIQFADFAAEIVEVSDINAKNIQSTIFSMGTTISSYAEDTGKTFPFVKIPHFEERGQVLLDISGARHVSLNLLVAKDEREKWEEFSVANQGWVQEGLDAQGKDVEAYPITPYIHRRDDDNFIVPNEEADDMYSVVWQVTPAPEVPTLVNHNAMSTNFSDIVELLEATNRETFSPILEDENEITAYVGQPESYLVQPVFKEVTGETMEKTFVGYINALLPWDNYFKNIIPDNLAPMHLVLKNTCGQVVTFEVIGPKVNVLSVEEDLHDPFYDPLEVNTHFQVFEGRRRMQESHDARNSEANMGAQGNGMGIGSQGNAMSMGHEGHNMQGGEGMDHEGHSSLYHTPEAHAAMLNSGKYYCWYEYSIYPTNEFHEAYTTQQPLWSTLGVVFIFFLTSAIFVLHDLLVTRRQKRVEASAARSNALVSSLFPAQVRDRLLQDNEDGTKQSYKQSNAPGTTSMMDGNNRSALHSDYQADLDTTSKLLETKPIADLFPSATVLFADICGFTAWSSVREPTQVFTLLEQIYNSFDVIARKRRIFKVETIGDCYVAGKRSAEVSRAL